MLLVVFLRRVERSPDESPCVLLIREEVLVIDDLIKNDEFIICSSVKRQPEEIKNDESMYPAETSRDISGHS
jgi:hypothetical protein